MKLLKEINENPTVLTEGKGSTKKYFIEGIFLQGDMKNKNGRIYPKNILVPEVNRYIKEMIEERRAFGELGHPDSPTINLPLVSHMIRSLKEDGSNYIGKAEILDTPNGKIVKQLIDAGAKLGVSSRGVGSLNEKTDGKYVQEDFFLATPADIVADPSAPDAFVEGLLEEKEWIFENDVWKKMDLENARTLVEQSNRKTRNELKIKIFEHFINNLAKRIN